MILTQSSLWEQAIPNEPQLDDYKEQNLRLQGIVVKTASEPDHP